MLKQYYEYYKTTELNDALTNIKKYVNQDDFYDMLEELAYNKNYCIEVMNNKETIYTNSLKNKGCIDINTNAKVLRYKLDFINGNTETFGLKITNQRLDNLTLLYGLKLENGNYVFINTSLEPIDSTISVLQNQLLIVTSIVVMLSILIAYFISRSLSKPITKITTSAKRLSEGDYTIEFTVDSDINELKELGITLDYMKNVLQRTDELRRDLMSNVSHDLKTPLTMIKAYAEMERDLKVSKEKHKENMNVIIEEVDRLTILVNDILNLSKLENNIDKLNLEEFDLIALIHTILNRFKIFSYTKHYEFIFDYEDPLLIKADKSKMEQVIYNLVGNAINYTGDDKKVFINILNNKKEVRVEIKDTGKGIKKDELDKVWDKYYKTEKNYKRQAIGTGIGLSIVKNIFREHKFKYGIISKDKKGSTFYFEIPKDKEKK